MKNILILTTIFLVACASHEKKEEMKNEVIVSKVISDIHSPGERVKGHFEAMDEDDQIKIKVQVTGLKPNTKHGFHIHENGICEGPEYKTAGGHFNPYKLPHGAPHMKSHLGDLGNLEADKKGVAEKEITIAKHESDDLQKIIGKALIVHEKADDMKTQPTGNAGGRIGCGIIKPI